MLKVRIISPEKELYCGEVKSVLLPGSLAPFEVFPHHAAIVSSLESGEISLRMEGGSRESIHIESGFVRCEKDCLTICVEQ